MQAQGQYPQSLRHSIIVAKTHNEERVFHSQPMPLSYSTIAAAKRLTGANQMTLALVKAVKKQS